jgi:hypothetical protein
VSGARARERAADARPALRAPFAQPSAPAPRAPARPPASRRRAPAPHPPPRRSYGINAAALLGLADAAAAQLLQRATAAPAPGYRFQGFAAHMQDFDPSADYFANMNRALQDMLIQSGDDGFQATTVVLFPAWPCGWDVSFKLWGPLATSVEVVYAGGKLVSIDVQPPQRAGAVKWANCVVAA